MQAKIYKPTKNPMQSGRRSDYKWLLTYAKEHDNKIDPLMGWTSENEANAQIKLYFYSLEEAIAYAKRKGLIYKVETKNTMRKQIKRVYAQNFSSNRKTNWTH